MPRGLRASPTQVLEQQLYQMSWGGATVYIQQKLTEPEDPEAEDEELDEQADESEDSGANADYANAAEEG